MRNRVVRMAILTAGLALVTTTSIPSWAGQYIEREDCAEAAARMPPIPPGCARQQLVQTAVTENRQGQPSCRIETVQYLCPKPSRHQSVWTRAEYFPLGATADTTPAPPREVFSSAPERETPAERSWFDQALVPDVRAGGWKFPEGIPVAGVDVTEAELRIRYVYGVNEKSTSVPWVNHLVKELDELQAKQAPLRKRRPPLSSSAPASTRHESGRSGKTKTSRTGISG